MIAAFPLLRVQRTTGGNGLSRFIEPLEQRCLLSATPALAADVVLPPTASTHTAAPVTAPTSKNSHVPKTQINFYAGAGTIDNAVNAAITGTTTTAPATAPTPPSTPTTVPGLAPLNTLPGENTPPFNFASFTVDSLFGAQPILPGFGGTTPSEQILGLSGGAFGSPFAG